MTLLASSDNSRKVLSAPFCPSKLTGVDTSAGTYFELSTLLWKGVWEFNFPDLHPLTAGREEGGLGAESPSAITSIPSFYLILKETLFCGNHIYKISDYIMK